MIDYKDLAGRIKTLADRYEDSSLADGLREEIADLRTVVSLLEGMADQEPVAEVLWHDPETEIIPDAPGKVIDGSMAFMESAAIGTKLYARPAPQPQPERQSVSDPCIGNDPNCPCQDGDPCHYRDHGDTKAMPIPQPQPVSDPRPCTCHPDDNPPVPCAQQYALNECRAASEPTEAQIEYEILCNGECVAGASGEGADAEILHYLTQYEEGGPCEVYAVTRRLVDRAALATKEQPE